MVHHNQRRRNFSPKVAIPSLVARTASSSAKATNIRSMSLCEREADAISSAASETCHLMMSITTPGHLAISSASLRTASSSWPAGTVSRTRPNLNAPWPFRTGHESTMSFAAYGPTSRTSRGTQPQGTGQPSTASGNDMETSCAAILRSHESASTKPPPSTSPCRLAMVMGRILAMRSVILRPRSSDSRRFRSGLTRPPTSAPRQK